MRLLIIGGSGFLGTELVRQAVAAGDETVATYHSRPGHSARASWHRLDVRRRQDVDDLLGHVRPDVAINATSGLSDWSVTADGAVHVALAAMRHPCRLVHVSSDAVFSGAGVHYDQTHPPDPVTPYGAAKAAAETAVRLLTPTAVVARTSLIVGHGRSVHERRVHDLAARRQEGVLFTDDIRCPVHVADLAAALRELAASRQSGVCHLAGSDALSRYELGILIAERDGIDPRAVPAGRKADSLRPGAVDVRLDSRATQRNVSTRLRGAREFLREKTQGPQEI